MEDLPLPRALVLKRIRELSDGKLRSNDRKDELERLDKAARIHVAQRLVNLICQKPKCVECNGKGCMGCLHTMKINSELGKFD